MRGGEEVGEIGEMTGNITVGKRWKTDGVAVEDDRLSAFSQCLYFRVEGEDGDVRLNESAHQVVITGGGATEWTGQSEWRSQDGRIDGE